jgi:DNA-binding response OmpR family regulator
MIFWSYMWISDDAGASSPLLAGQEGVSKCDMAKVFVVEDDIDLCETYVDALESAGHTVYSAYTGTEAVDALIRRRAAPDVVVLDLQLPGNSGIVILGVIRGLSRLCKTKVIIASGYLDTGQWAVSQWGADLFLEKPISMDVLTRTIDEFTSSPAGSGPTGTQYERETPVARVVNPPATHAPNGT